MSRAEILRDRVSSFCQAFLDPNLDAVVLLDEHFIRPSGSSAVPRITEHGPAWASSRLPFLGRTFEGRAANQQVGGTCEEYFALLSSTLAFHPDEHTFPDKRELIVDPTNDIVSVVARARFSSVKTRRGWQEQFIYRLSGFDEQGRIGHWEIWADPLSAWMAVGDVDINGTQETG